MGGGTQTTVQKADPWDRVQPHLGKAADYARGLFESGGMSADPYGGPRVAGPTLATQMGQGMAVGKAMGPQLTDTASSTLQGMMDPSNYGAGLEAVKQEALGSAIPSAVSMFAGNGMTDSTGAMDTVGRAATNAVAPIEYGAYQNAQNRAMSAAGMAPQMDAAGYLPSQMMQQIGMQQQAQNQAGIDAQMAQHYEAGNKQANDLGAYTQMLLGYGGQGETRSSTQSSNPGFMGTMGSIMQGASFLPFLFSDRRLKEDIRRVGETHEGTPIYVYRYKGSDTYQMGVMADEVPQAIAANVAGFNLVDYARVH